MADLYLDEDIHHGAPAELERLGHSAVHGAYLHRGATDDVQLLEAVRQRRVLVTSNHRDFVLLHHAWTHWSREWASWWAQTRPPQTLHPGILTSDFNQVAPWATPHPGILVVPNGRGPEPLAALIDGFFRPVPVIPPNVLGRLYRWIGAPAPAPGRWREIPPTPL